jgi:hypothetical protein
MSEKEMQLALQLLEKTRAKAIAWQPTARSNEFVAPFRGDVTFTVGRYEGNDVNYSLTMRDRENREMFELVDYGGGALQELYKAAHDAALNVEEAIDAILDDLRKVS